MTLDANIRETLYSFVMNYIRHGAEASRISIWDDEDDPVIRTDMVGRVIHESVLMELVLSGKLVRSVRVLQPQVEMRYYALSPELIQFIEAMKVLIDTSDTAWNETVMRYDSLSRGLSGTYTPEEKQAVHTAYIEAHVLWKVGVELNKVFRQMLKEL
jgi:hypothetical protein